MLYQVFKEYIHVIEGLGRRDHVERDGQGAALVHVVQPQLRTGELPLHVTVGLKHGQGNV